jgi:hypothetical protein
MYHRGKRGKKEKDGDDSKTAIEINLKTFADQV